VPRYYVLNCIAPLELEHWNLDVDDGAKSKRWAAGNPFSQGEKREAFNPPHELIEVTTAADDEYLPRVYAALYWNPIPLMNRPLVAALKAAGVDNLQTFETKLLTVRGQNPPPADHYLAVNIVGRVAAADLQKSEINPAVHEKLISMDFYSLSVDDSKARGFLMFRLAENISTVLVHERVKKQIEAEGINTLTWLAPEKWAG